MCREEAIMELLSLPDEPCLAGKRTHRITAPAIEDQELVKRDLGIAFLSYHCQSHRDISQVVSASSWRRLRIARRA